MILNRVLVCVGNTSLLFCKNDGIVYDYALCDTCICLDESSIYGSLLSQRYYISPTDIGNGKVN